MFLLLGSAGWTSEVQTGVTESHFLSLEGLGGWKLRFICNSTVDANGACDTKGLWMQPRHLLQDYFDISKLSISSLRGHKFLVFILPCLSPSPDTLARGRLSRTFCFQPCLYSAMVSILVVPPADKGGGNVFMPCFGVPWCSLSRGYVLPPQPPWLHSPPMLLWPQESLPSDPWVILWHRIFVSLSISKNIYSCSTSNCDWLSRIWKTKGPW